MKKTAEQLKDELERFKAEQDEILRQALQKYNEAKRVKRKQITKAEKQEQRDRIRLQMERDHSIMIIFRDVFKGIDISETNAREFFEHIKGTMNDWNE